MGVALANQRMPLAWQGAGRALTEAVHFANHRAKCSWADGERLGTDTQTQTDTHTQ